MSVLLTGRALDVYDRLSNEDAAEYDKLNDALLSNFYMTERGFRKKFLYGRPEKLETFNIQLSSRLKVTLISGLVWQIKVQVHDQIFFAKDCMPCNRLFYAEIVAVIDPFFVGVCP